MVKVACMLMAFVSGLNALMYAATDRPLGFVWYVALGALWFLGAAHQSGLLVLPNTTDNRPLS